MKGVYLVTGIHGGLARSLASRLWSLPGTRKVYGLAGPEEGPPSPKKVEVLEIDPRDAAIVEFIAEKKIDTVVHLDFLEEYRHQEEVFDRNVMGMLHVSAAAAEAGARKLVLASTTWTYGAVYDNPNYLVETRPLRGRPHLAWLKERVEIERYAKEFVATHPRLITTILRFAPLLGPAIDSPLARYLGLPSPPVAMGFDPLLQLLHEDDAVEALLAACRQDVRGAVNVAADGVIPLLKLLRKGKLAYLPVFAPIANLALKIAPGLASFKQIPIEVDHLKFNCVADTKRMKEELEFSPRVGLAEVVEELTRKGPAEALEPEEVQGMLEEVEEDWW